MSPELPLFQGHVCRLVLMGWYVVICNKWKECLLQSDDRILFEFQILIFTQMGKKIAPGWIADAKKM